MGICLSAMVTCVTRCHDSYINWKWDREDDLGHFDGTLTETIQLQNTTKLQRLRSIHTAVIDKNTTEIRRILDEQPESGRVINSYGETALHLACKLGYHHSIDTLMEGECSSNVCTEIGTPLHCITKAVRTGYMSVEMGKDFIGKLVRHGADVNAMDKGHKTALFLASEIGNFELMQRLLQLGAAVNSKDINGFTPLYMSAIRGDLACMKLLLDSQDIEVDACDEAGRTPLIAALITIMNNLRYERLPCDAYNIGQPHDNALMFNRYNRMGVVEALLRAGANPNESDTHSRSPLVIAFVILEMDNIRGIAGQVLSTSGGPQIRCSLQRNNFTDAEMIQSSPESVYTALNRMLVLYGARMPRSWDKDDSNAPEWLKQLYRESKRMWTEGLVQKPFRLLQLARIEIRTQLAATNNLMNVEKLPLPQHLWSYIQVQYY